MSSSVFSLYAYIYIYISACVCGKKKKRERMDRNVLCAMRVEIRTFRRMIIVITFCALDKDGCRSDDVERKKEK